MKGHALKNLQQTIGPAIKKPYQRVFLPNAEIWKNRPIDHYHLQMPPGIVNILVECPDKRCPVKFHVLQEWSYNDPHSLALMFKLKPGDKVLLLIKYCGKTHVSFFTFDRMEDYQDYLRFHSRELSKDCWFFSPSNNDFNDFPLTVQWACIKYLAIVKSEQKPFGKYGGLPCFMRELARLTGNDLKTVKKAVCKLDALNPMPKRPPLRVFGEGKTIYKLINEKTGQDRLSFLSSATEDKRGINSFAYLVLCLTEQGKLNSFLKIIDGWRPKDIAQLRESLDMALKWYNYHTDQTQLTDAWQKRWCRAFSL
jgi:hypothetical protein